VIQKAEHSVAKHDFLRTLGAHLESLGFNPKSSGQSFYRNFAVGKSAFHVSFIPHQTDFDLTADVAIRINAIEDLVNEYDTKRSPSEKRQSMTLGGDLGNISEGRQLRWTVADLNDIPRICDQVANKFERVGLEFLRTHSEVAAVRQVLVSSDHRDTLLAPILGSRAMRAIASTYILDGAGGIPALTKRFEAKLLEKQDLYLTDFRALCRGLLGKSGTGEIGDRKL
jgi:hypothetical protein